MVPEDPHPGVDKLVTVQDGYILQNVSGIRTRVVSRLDGKGYDITKRKLTASHFVSTPKLKRF